MVYPRHMMFVLGVLVGGLFGALGMALACAAGDR
jgi:hypothetical protein